MAEDLFSIDKIDIDVNHKLKAKLSTEVDGINEMSVMKQIRPILIFLPALGINIKEGRSTKCQIVRMFYLFILLLISMWLIGRQMYQLLNSNSVKEGSWLVSFTFHYVVVAVVYVAAFKSQLIGSLLNDMMSLYTEISEVGGANRRLKRRLWPLWVITLINIIVIYCTTIVEFSDYEHKAYRDTFPIEFFGITSNSSVVIYAVILGNVFAMNLDFFLFILFGCFAILQCFMIKECFAGLHIKLKAKGDEYLQDYLIGHRKISRLVDRFNKTFHPAILTLVGFLMINLVSFTADVTRYTHRKENSFDVYYKWLIIDSFSIAQMLIVFIIFVYFGNEIQCEARKGIEILLDSSISIASSTNEEMHNKNTQIIRLFIAHLNTAPVAISASGLFDINAHLITIIISIAFAYFSLIFSKSDESNKEVKNGLCNCSCLSNNYLSLNLSNDLSTQ